MVDWYDGHDWCSVVVDSLTSSDGTDLLLDSGLRRSSISFDPATGKLGSVTAFRWYDRTGMASDADVLFHPANSVVYAPHQGIVNLRPRTDRL